MSTVIFPVPARRRPKDVTSFTAARDARWWRLDLAPRADGRFIVVRTDAQAQEGHAPTWITWEFFDGHSTWIDVGMDKITVDEVRLVLGSGRGHLDVLSVQQPTPSPQWCPMTAPNDTTHPDSACIHRVHRYSDAGRPGYRGPESMTCVTARGREEVWYSR